MLPATERTRRELSYKEVGSEAEWSFVFTNERQASRLGEHRCPGVPFSLAAPDPYIGGLENRSFRWVNDELAYMAPYVDHPPAAAAVF